MVLYNNDLCFPPSTCSPSLLLGVLDIHHCLIFHIEHYTSTYFPHVLSCHMGTTLLGSFNGTWLETHLFKLPPPHHYSLGKGVWWKFDPIGLQLIHLKRVSLEQFKAFDANSRVSLTKNNKLSLL